MVVTDQAVVETAADAFNAHDLERRDGKHALVSLMFDRLLMPEQLRLVRETECGP